MRVHLEARRSFWNNLKRGKFRGIRVLADAFDKGNGRSIYGQIESMNSLEYYSDDKPSMAFAMMMKDWGVAVECCIHIMMTSQERPVKKLASEPEKVGFIYVAVESLRNHAADLMKKLPLFLLRTKTQPMHEKQTDVLLIVFRNGRLDVRISE